MAWRERELPALCKGYGLPLYCAAWVNEGARGRGGGRGSDNNACDWSVLLGGGGGEGQRGIGNALLLSKFNPNSMSFLDRPVRRWEGDVPHRIAVHPQGRVAFCSFSNSCRWFEINESAPAEQWPSVIEEAGLQSALACHSDNNGNSLLATGGEDGHLRLFSWSTGGCELIFDIADAHTSVKDLAFSCDGRLLASLGRCGSCRLWNTESNNRLVANIRRENDEVFEFCRFSKTTDNDQILYLTSEQGRTRRIISWNCQSQEKTALRDIVCEDRISAFDISADGKMLAVGTIEGDILILNSSNMSLLTKVKKAHSGLVMSLAFYDSRALLSTSVDTRARVTLITENKRNGFCNFFIFVIILLPLVVQHFIRRNEQSSLCSSIFTSLRLSSSSYNFGFAQTASAAHDYEDAPT